MKTLKRSPLPWSLLGVLAALVALTTHAAGQVMLSGNETKVDLTGGGPKVIPGATADADSVTLLDFSQFPPSATHVKGVANTVVGPPSNIAISPDGKVALVANSIRLDPSAAAGWVPENHVHVLDLTARPPKVIGRAQTDLQPSGIAFAPGGRTALVANRAGGTVSVLTVDGTNVKQAESVKVCEPAESVSDVAISPDGKLALASVQKGGYVAVLKIENGKVTNTGRKVSAYGQPYRVVITPDGELGLTAGMGNGNGVDVDCVTVLDLKGGEPRAVDYVPIGASPESIEISPDGKLLAAVVMDGSNLAPTDAHHTTAGALVILERRDRTFAKSQRLPVGRIPEGVAFTGDGRHLVVQCHPDRQLWLFDVKDGRVTDTGDRIEVPGMPSSLRAAPAR